MMPSKRARAFGLLPVALLMATPLPAQVSSTNPESGWADPAALPATDPAASPATEPPPASPAKPTTLAKGDVFAAAEGVFGKGTEGLAKMLESVLKDQGEPNAYIRGKEASAALVLGVRYGSGKMTHAVEGERDVYWTGPSVGFDAGGDATKVFVLVYNLYDGQELYRRYPQVEGRAYYFGGLSATYMRRGKVVLIPIRLGVGLRLGANVGYMKFTEKSKWLPL